MQFTKIPLLTAIATHDGHERRDMQLPLYTVIGLSVSRAVQRGRCPSRPVWRVASPTQVTIEQGSFYDRLTGSTSVLATGRPTTSTRARLWCFLASLALTRLDTEGALRQRGRHARGPSHRPRLPSGHAGHARHALRAPKMGPRPPSKPPQGTRLHSIDQRPRRRWQDGFAADTPAAPLPTPWLQAVQHSMIP